MHEISERAATRTKTAGDPLDVPKKGELVLSPQYVFVRGRQLEGTYPGSPLTGIWPITAMRVGRGWGSVPEDAWPYDSSLWPPAEPAGLDALARNYRLNTYYRRVHTTTDHKATLLHVPVISALEITEKWFDAPGGRIPLITHSHSKKSSHTVLLVGYDDPKGEFKFQNSWGTAWGESGFGYIPYEVFQEIYIESWAALFLGSEDASSEPRSRFTERNWGIRDVTGSIFHCNEFVAPNGDRTAWAYAVERDGVLQIEELFVMPEFRRRGMGNSLFRSMADLAARTRIPFKFWISHADAAAENLAVIEKLCRLIGLQFVPSNERWASYVLSSGK